jgi:putative ABC transport system substrate-binding protein
MSDWIGRREFFALAMGTGAAFAIGSPLRLDAQQPTIPVIGFLSSLSAKDAARILGAVRQGLAETGFVEGRNVAIEYRFAEGQYERLPAMAADLVGRKVAAIAAVSGTPSAVAAKAATTTIPIVFAIGGDPVTPGLVGSLNRPGGNVTGATFFTAPLATKRLELVRQLAPTAATIGVLTNPGNPPSALEGTVVPAAAKTMGLQTKVVHASSADQIDSAFVSLVADRIGALYVSADPLFFTHRNRIAALATRHAMIAIYADREIAEAGGLVSYGASRSDAYRQAGRYVGRILKGEKAGDLPVMLPTKFELVLNLKTAKALGLELPPTVLALADEVIE